MTLTGSRRRTLGAGVALIAITNAVALAGVAWNRSGEPDSVLTLSQRELSQPYRFGFDREAGGLVLGLRWRVLTAEAAASYYPDHYGTPEWLDQAKLAALGFDVSRPSGARVAERRYGRQLPREALVVLELDGPAHRKALERARERAKKEAASAAAGSDGTRPKPPGQSAAEFLKLEETSNSRLFAVDAGLDAPALRAKYPDRARYAIVRGKVRAQYHGGRSRDALWSGTIEGVDDVRVNMPNEFRGAIGPVPHSIAWGGVAEGGPPFQVTVAFGKRFEPWVTAASTTR